jgi:hypothetical protein
MATIPTTFLPVQPRDVNQRTVQAYKHYNVNSDTFSTASGHSRYDAIYLGKRFPEINVGDNTYGYPINSEIKVNKHVMWHGLDHKYYQHPFDPALCHEAFDITKNEKLLWYSASILSIPYFEYGERIKENTVTLKIASKNIFYTASDDGHGNLQDHDIITSSFASASNELLHLSFNNEYRQFRFSHGTNPPFGLATEKFEYFFKGADTNLHSPWKQTNDVYDFQNIDIVKGVRTTGFDQTSGLAAKFNDSSSFIRIAHNKDGIPVPDYQKSTNNLFDRFGICDDYTISFWVKKGTNSAGSYSLVNKNTIKRERVFDPITNTESIRDVVYEPPAITQNYDDYRTPFAIGIECFGNDFTTYHFQASNGDRSVHLSGSTTTTTGSYNTSWDHILVRNENSNVQLYVNGGLKCSNVLPKGKLGNAYDIILGSTIGAIGSAGVPTNITSPIISDLTLPTNVTRYCTTDLFISASAQLTIPNNTVFIINGNLSIDNDASMVIENDARVYVGGNLILSGSEDDEQVQFTGDTSTLIFSARSGDDDLLFRDFELAEFRLYDYAVNDTAIASLENRHYISASLYQSNIMGNVFYKNGAIAVTSPLEKHNTGSGVFLNDGASDLFDLKYRGVHTIYENEVMVRIPQGKMNVSQNPTATFRKPTQKAAPCLPNENQAEPGYFRRSMFVSGTAVPYITTIGLYDEHRRLLAVGKLSQAVQKRPDIDTNIILRWDY